VQPDYIMKTFLYILQGCGLTLELYAVTALFSVPLAVVFALGRVSGGRTLKRALEIYSWIFRGTPLLLQLFFTYYGLSIFGISLSPFLAASITFIVNYAAYLMEIFRAGIESIDKGQYEAARALNMTYWQTMRRIILPQTIKRVLPPVSNEAITLIKDTALVVVIGMGDLLRSAKEIFTRDFTITPFVVAAAIYLGLTSLVVMGFRKLEKRYAVYD
jgi:polar amino acid transport system permease protein